MIVSEAWRAAYPGAWIGMLAMRGVANPEQHAGLDAEKAELERQLRVRYDGYDRAALRALPVMQAYHTYYKRFRKSYHVQLQLESIVLKGKPIPSVAALVEAMFMAELKDLMLTAGHDLELVQPPVGIYLAEGNEKFVRITGQEQELKAGDMFVADAQGVLSSVIYGPDLRTRIRAETQQFLCTSYAPPGIGKQAVTDHLQSIQGYVSLIAPEAEVLSLEVHGAG
jgi:DNA/RNA-binding domain of Phe-tRNA-synthetase-like protein